MRILLTLTFTAIFTFVLPAQPPNDDCLQAQLIENTVDWCSEEGELNNNDASNDPTLEGSCFSGNWSDVWFTLTPTTTNLSIVVASDNFDIFEMTLFEGDDCSSLTEVACAVGNPNTFIAQLLLDDLTLGVSYYLLVQGVDGTEGDFQLCLKGFNGTGDLSSDCPEATVLCSKDNFVIPQISGPGDDPTEANDAGCLNVFPGFNVESSSTWFVWTAGSDGPLTFILDPLNFNDDLDFVVYEFPNGPGDCGGQIPLRCMASSCAGPTGLDDTSTDTEEPPGCGLVTQDNFLSAIDMEAGKSYGIMVNNFSQTGLGFEVSFGGTGEFAGPEGGVSVSPAGEVCTDEEVELTAFFDIPTGISIESWSWDFGVNASLPNSTTPGPHTVSYSTVGTKLVLLEIVTDEGCLSTQVVEIEVVCCDAPFAVQPDIQPPTCSYTADGSIALTISNPNGPPFDVVWSTGETGATLSGVPAGTYEVTIVDPTNCQEVQVYEVIGPDTLIVDTLLTLPTCDAGMDGVIVLEPTGGNTPYTYSLNGSPPTMDNIFDNLASSPDYTVAITDANGCVVIFDVPLEELELLLEPGVEAAVNPSCAGLSDGQITVMVANGLPPYEYNFNDGNGWGSTNVADSLPSGTYTVDVRDVNLCSGSFEWTLEDPAELAIALDVSEVTCFGGQDGSIEAIPMGGTPPYSYNWDTGETIASIADLPFGNYHLTVTDGNGCESDTAWIIMEPAPMSISADSIRHLTCNGANEGSLWLSVSGGLAPHVFSLDGQAAQASPVFDGLAAGLHLVVVTDANGCEEDYSFTLTEPEPVLVTLDTVNPVELGYTAVFNATTLPEGLPVVWSPPTGLSCVDCNQPTVQPMATTWYTATAVDELGCIGIDSVRMEVTLNRPLFAPNAFSPNDDGRNDSFQVYFGPGVERVLSLSVYDRWGSLIYQTENLSDGKDVLSWDGEADGLAAPASTYVFVAEVLFIDGFRKTLSGSFNLIR